MFCFCKHFVSALFLQLYFSLSKDYIFFMAFILAAAVFIFIWWNAALPFYHDKNTEKLVSDESKCFSPRCRSIIYDKGRDYAVLMIHGYPTCPNMYTYSAKRLDEAGFDVFAPLIPTFGADVSQFSKTNYTQWLDFIDSYYLDLRKRYRHLAVLGVSMGGAMTLDLAEKYSATPFAMDRIAVISAPVAYNCLRRGVITNPLGYFARTLNIFIKSIGLGVVDGRSGADDGNEEWTGYKGIVMLHGISLTKAFNRIRKNLKRIRIPMFVMHDRNDRTVSFKNLAIIEKFCKDNIVVKREVEMDSAFRHSHHSLLMYHSVQKEYTDDIISFLKGGKSGKEE